MLYTYFFCTVHYLLGHVLDLFTLLHSKLVTKAILALTQWDRINATKVKDANISWSIIHWEFALCLQEQAHNNVNI